MSTSGSREAAFIGKITASATHEIRNVLAIVKESAGLIDDLMQAAVTRGPLDGDRVLKATDAHRRAGGPRRRDHHRA